MIHNFKCIPISVCYSNDHDLIFDDGDLKNGSLSDRDRLIVILYTKTSRSKKKKIDLGTNIINIISSFNAYDNIDASLFFAYI